MCFLTFYKCLDDWQDEKEAMGKNLFLDACAKDEEDQEALRRKSTDDSGQPEGTP